MAAPPGAASNTRNGITGTRTKAAIRKATATRFQAAARAAGFGPLSGYQIRSLLASLAANSEEPTERELMESLMRAPWAAKPQRRRYRLGESGWRTRT